MTDQPDSWLRSRITDLEATVTERNVRLAAVERHATDLRQLNEQLREQVADHEAENAILRAELAQAEARGREAGAVMALLPDVDRRVWQP